ncbi:hypothetical protein IscW_ISCW013328 [Ixodes scapularis]|uniref:Uncharacterized protein n=1 Tax=Ixodes scapularis TaxID=6945 RepID=B7QDL6_IXOSC|nr:hypothetical protein IscW_ISCW013328 [Ixodes scapularis]|eukprot:XP_002413630.1 hypothetical protein IscW_ISCW013328 [Ixodes scapularis]
MLVSDNENFQQLAESLKQARHCLEKELKTQREQHVKATKELENEHCRALDEAAKSELQVLKTKREEALEANLELRGQLEQMTKDFCHYNRNRKSGSREEDSGAEVYS